MTEKIMQDLLKSYPCEFIEDGLEYVDREITTGGRRLDLVFKDKKDRLLLVEVQLGSLDTKHIDRHIDFVEGYLEKYPDENIRLMYIANKIDPLRKSFLEKRGYEYLEIPDVKFLNLAKKNNILIEVNNMQEDNLVKESFDDFILNSIDPNDSHNEVTTSAYFLVQSKIKEYKISSLFETNFNQLSSHEESPLFLRVIMETLLERKYKVIFISYDDLKNIDYRKGDIFIFPPWYVSGKKFLIINNKYNSEIVDLIKKIPENGCHIITLTRCCEGFWWKEYSNLYYTGNKNRFIRSRINSLKILNSHPVLTDGISEVIQSGEFSNDFYCALAGKEEGFTTLISKIPQKQISSEFNLFGYMKVNSNSYFFNVDIANAGSNYSHKKLLVKIIDNIIRFIRKQNAL